MSAKPGSRDIVVTRVLHAPVEQIWNAWSDPDHVMCWWGPTGFTSPSAAMDFREGGTSLVCMRAPKEFGGQDMYNTWTYQKIVPTQRIEFIMGFADKAGRRVEPARLGLHPEISQDVRQVVTFKALGNHKTEMTVTEYGYTSDQVLEMSRLGLQRCLGKMAACLDSAR